MNSVSADGRLQAAVKRVYWTRPPSRAWRIPSAGADGPSKRQDWDQLYPRPPRWLLRAAATIVCFGIAGALFPAMAYADTLKIAAWNIEHLRDAVDEPPSQRTEDQFRRLREHADRLDADAIAVQEVENEKALARVFDPARYEFFLSSRSNPQRTGFAVRKSISARHHPDLIALGAGGRLRHGVDVEISAGGQSVRLLSIHLKSFCFEGSTASPRTDHCRKLAMQVPALEQWIDARAAEGTPFAVLGDFNRRFDAPGEDFWPQIDDGVPAGLKLQRVTAGRKATCNGGKYPLFIDHIVFGPLLARLIVPGSFEELVYAGAPLSDHCPIAVTLEW